MGRSKGKRKNCSSSSSSCNCEGKQGPKGQKGDPGIRCIDLVETTDLINDGYVVKHFQSNPSLSLTGGEITSTSIIISSPDDTAVTVTLLETIPECECGYFISFRADIPERSSLTVNYDGKTDTYNGPSVQDISVTFKDPNLFSLVSPNVLLDNFKFWNNCVDSLELLTKGTFQVTAGSLISSEVTPFPPSPYPIFTDINSIKYPPSSNKDSSICDLQQVTYVANIAYPPYVFYAIRFLKTGRYIVSFNISFDRTITTGFSFNRMTAIPSPLGVITTLNSSSGNIFVSGGNVFGTHLYEIDTAGTVFFISTDVFNPPEGNHLVNYSVQVESVL